MCSYLQARCPGCSWERKASTPKRSAPSISNLLSLWGGLRGSKLLPQLILLDAFFSFYFISFFSLLFLSALNDLTGPSAGSLAQVTYSIPKRWVLPQPCKKIKLSKNQFWVHKAPLNSLQLHFLSNGALEWAKFLLYFRLPSTFLPSKDRSITTLGTRWHVFFFNPFFF